MKGLIPLLEKISRFLSAILLSKINKKYYPIVFKLSEVFFICLTLVSAILMTILLIDNNNGFAILIISIYSSLVIVLSEFALGLKKNMSTDEHHGIIFKLSNRVNKNHYLVNRLLILCGRTSLGLMVFILIIYILLLGIATFNNLPISIYYFVLICIPIGLSGWVYLTSFDNESQNIRRILAYFFLLLLALGKSYSDFKILLDIAEHNSFSNYLFYIILTIFMAVDRLVKSILDDLKEYNKKHLKKVKG